MTELSAHGRCAARVTDRSKRLPLTRLPARRPVAGSCVPPTSGGPARALNGASGIKVRRRSVTRKVRSAVAPGAARSERPAAAAAVVSAQRFHERVSQLHSLPQSGNVIPSAAESMMCLPRLRKPRSHVYGAGRVGRRGAELGGPGRRRARPLLYAGRARAGRTLFGRKGG